MARARAWLGLVVPKRHARRAVTRSLVKRQVRAAAGRVVAPAGAGPVSAGAAEARGLPGGLWIVRMRAPYPRDEYPSAASDALRAALRGELDRLFAAALRQCPGGAARRRPRSGAGVR